MSERIYPMSVRGLPPEPEGFTLLEPGLTPKGLPDAYHTGGLWEREGEVWKPLDGIVNWVGHECHAGTQEVEALEAASGLAGFPHNWRVEVRPVAVPEGTFDRHWLVRQRAYISGKDFDLNEMPTDAALEIEQGIWALNDKGWSLGEPITIGFTVREGKYFIVDLSNAHPDVLKAFPNDDYYSYTKDFLVSCRLERTAALRGAGARILEWVALDPVAREQYGIVKGQIAYASRNRPMSSLWASIPGAVYVDGDYTNTRVHTWVIVPAMLPEKTVKAYELAWAWGRK